MYTPYLSYPPSEAVTVSTLYQHRQILDTFDRSLIRSEINKFAYESARDVGLLDTESKRVFQTINSCEPSDQ